ncbi:hypothetical protein EPD60_08000 [Flaviaesturariibacter flavus]|uniref:SbsA Ig-like domain-containing protein n=1 Tax=Flaviaesturariibacter flavus TaxID=2502780 RepID=A0A4R1BAK7_9BACT|nr:Ig-like domain-containing protein [Flaviaesturariibacter flavus]TCJ13948.1 hypothetical protein EPD60_08000 [Flaviaesturariibacter flavus]
MKKAFFLFITALGGVLALTGGTGCATIIPPQGGPRDSLPPKLVKATPAEGAVNVNTRTIELTFDEFVDISREGGGELVMSPLYTKRPDVRTRLRTVTIELKDSLEPNTTYSFNFDGAIKDINEGNTLRNFTYTFSTGPALDSLTYSGSVQLAETGGIDTTLTVALYRNLRDSAVVLESPRYITRVNGSGNFTFRNLPGGTFAVYAFDDKSRTRRYLSKSQLFAFADSPIVVRPGAPELRLFAYVEQPVAAAGANGARTAPQPATDRRLKYTPAVTTAQELQGDYRINFDNRVRSLDSGKVRLVRDSVFTEVPRRLSLDSTGRVLAVRAAWASGERYALILGKDFATDTTGRSQLRNDTLRFAAKKTSDYGNLLLRFRNVKAGLNPVLQMIQNNSVVFSAPIGSGELSRALFIPGDYELRVLFDTNGNGKWDPGAFFNGRRQPEIVVPVDRRLVVKPDIENEIEIAVPDMPRR